jgi:hypothetical protein
MPATDASEPDETRRSPLETEEELTMPGRHPDAPAQPPTHRKVSGRLRASSSEPERSGMARRELERRVQAVKTALARARARHPADS